MIRTLASLLLAVAGIASAATTTPVQLLSPTGSTAGQAILSNGPSSAPTWGSVTATALAPVAANTVIANPTASTAAPVAHALPSCSTSNSALKYTSGTGLSCGTTFALTTSNTFTGNQTLGLSTPTLTLNDTSGANSAILVLQNNGSTRWQLFKSGSDNFAIGRYVSGAFVDNPISILNSTGVTSVLNLSATMTAGSVNNTPVGNTTPSTGAFTTISATGAITPSQTAGITGTNTNNDANAGAVGEAFEPTSGTVSITTATITNCQSQALSAGDWDVSGIAKLKPQSGDTVTSVNVGISTTSATNPPEPLLSQTGTISHTAGDDFTVMAQERRIKLSSAGTVYLVVTGNHSGGTLNAVCYIHARRPR